MERFEGLKELVAYLCWFKGGGGSVMRNRNSVEAERGPQRTTDREMGTSVQQPKEPHLANNLNEFRSGFLSRTSRNEHSPGNTLILTL